MKKEDAVELVKSVDDDMFGILVMTKVYEHFEGDTHAIKVFFENMTYLADDGHMADDMAKSLKSSTESMMNMNKDKAEEFLQNRFRGAVSNMYMEGGEFSSAAKVFGIDNFDELAEEPMEDDMDIKVVSSTADGTLDPIYVALKENKGSVKFNDRCKGFEIIDGHMIAFVDEEGCGLGIVPTDAILYMMPKSLFEAKVANDFETASEALISLFKQDYDED